MYNELKLSPLFYVSFLYHQNYLQDFGYLEKPDGRDATETEFNDALHTFQRFAGLPDTGKMFIQYTHLANRPETCFVIVLISSLLSEIRKILVYTNLQTLYRYSFIIMSAKATNLKFSPYSLLGLSCTNSIMPSKL